MFKDIFSKLIQDKGLSLYKVSKDTKIPKSIVYEWASGEREPASDYLISLADYLDCSVDYLLGRTNCPNITVFDSDGKPVLLEVTKDHPNNDQ